MKINGKKLYRVRTKPLTVATEAGPEDFTVNAMTTEQEEHFDSLFTEPVARKKIMKQDTATGLMEPVMVDNPDYQEQLEDHEQKRLIYWWLFCIPELSYDTVFKDKPDTWTTEALDKELRQLFSPTDVGRIVDAMYEVNGYGVGVVEQAKESFSSGT